MALMTSEDVTAVAASIAAAAAVVGVTLKLLDRRTKTKALKFEEAGAWIIHVKPTRLLEDCTVLLYTLQLSVRDGAHVKLIDVDTGDKNFVIPSGVEPKWKDVLVFSGRRRVYRKLFDKIPIKNR